MKAIVMHEVYINEQPYEYLFSVLSGDEEFIKNEFQKLQIKTRKALRLHYEIGESKIAW